MSPALALPPSAFGPPPTVVGREELIERSAVDPLFFCQAFFPGSFGQNSPPFHEELWALLNNSNVEKLAVAAFRGSAKTTNLRAFALRRVCFGISRFILFVSETARHSISSLKWIKAYVDNENGEGDLLVQTFGLRKGEKWSEDHIEIINDALGITVSIRAVGVENQIRGLNEKGKRPDLIVLDDPCAEENSGTEEQRKKLRDLVYGALFKSLAPRSECPEAKIVLLNTPIAADDLISQCENDPDWVFRRYGCYIDDGQGKEASAWPSRFPLEVLKKDEQAHRRRNMLSVFSREMRCELVSDEAAFFSESWLKIFDVIPDWVRSATIIGAIDPIPPPSEAEQKRGSTGKDYETVLAMAFAGRRVALVDLRVSRGHNPDWSKSNFFEVQERWRCQSWRVEGVAYQRVLKWLLEQEMKKRKIWVPIDAEADNRKKQIRIRQSLNTVCTDGELWIPRSATRFVEQFRAYPAVKNDDVLDAAAMAIHRGIRLGLFGSQSAAEQTEAVGALPEWRYAP